MRVLDQILEVEFNDIFEIYELFTALANAFGTWVSGAKFQVAAYVLGTRDNDKHVLV
jgi:hypothetical protein